MEMALSYSTIEELSERVRKQAVSPVELVEGCLERIKEFNPNKPVAEVNAGQRPTPLGLQAIDSSLWSRRFRLFLALGETSATSR